MSESEFVFSGDEGKRLDVFIASSADISRSRAAALIESGNVKVNGKPSNKSVRLCKNDIVSVSVPKAEPYRAKP